MVQYRLQHYPNAQGYQTQVIDYPGNVYSSQNVQYASNPILNSHANYQRYQQQPAQTATSNQYQTVRAASQTTTTHEPSTTSTTTTSTQLPVTAQTQPIEQVSAPVPAVRAPVHHQRRIVVSSCNEDANECE